MLRAVNRAPTVPVDEYYTMPATLVYCGTQPLDMHAALSYPLHRPLSNFHRVGAASADGDSVVTCVPAR